VIFTHDSPHKGLGWLFQNGHNGVELFFARSGVLICWRLIEEEETFGRISLRDFYIRRAFRILPPAMMFLAVVGVLGLCGVLAVGLREWLGAVFFVRNYSFFAGATPGTPYFTQQVWSLSVEEHLYLILPSLLILAGKRWRVPVLAALSAIVIAHRYMVLQTRPAGHVLFHTDVRLDALLIPAMFAVLLQSARLRTRFEP
jgi:peptidoglycan/LPS O-acetylase OafA/YrhL